MNAVEDFHKIRARAAAGVRNINAFVCQAIRKAYFLAEHGINPFHHVFDHFGRRVPDS
jgi:hypothetical protein